MHNGLRASGDCGEMLVEIDKLIRREIQAMQEDDPDKMINQKGLPPMISCHDSNYARSSSCISSSSTTRPVNLSLLDALREVNGMVPVEPNDVQNSIEYVKDMRPYRLFKTRMCQYGESCIYFRQGTCLFAHSPREIRNRPPPPDGYRSSAATANMYRQNASSFPFNQQLPVRTIRLEKALVPMSSAMISDLRPSSVESTWSISSSSKPEDQNYTSNSANSSYSNEVVNSAGTSSGNGIDMYKSLFDYSS